MRPWKQLLAALAAVAAGVFYLTHLHAAATQLDGQAPGHSRVASGMPQSTPLSDGTD